MNFIGRGEKRVELVLGLFFPKTNILSQVPITALLETEGLGPEHIKHKFDLVVVRSAQPDIVLEVNYKHGALAETKWKNVYRPRILQANKIPVTIDHYLCMSIFDTDTPRALRWDDLIDVIHPLRAAGVLLGLQNEA